MVSGSLSGYAGVGPETGVAAPAREDGEVDGNDEVVVSLEPAEPLVLRVVNHLGKPIPGDVPVAFDALLPNDAYVPLASDGYRSAAGSMDWTTQSRVDQSGERSVRFLDHMIDPARPVYPARAAQLRAFHVNVRGLLEFHPELVKFGDEVRFLAAQGSAVIELVLPATGAIQVHVMDASGLVTDARGTASLRWTNVPAAVPGRTFEVPLTYGCARWPNVVAGERPFSLELDAESHGQIWSTTRPPRRVTRASSAIAIASSSNV